MPTIGEVYNPLIEAAINDNKEGHNLIIEVGKKILEANPDRCPDLEDGIRMAKINLDYYCQYYPKETATKVKRFYELGSGFRGLDGNKWG